MKKFIALLTKTKGGTAKNDWIHDDSDIFQALRNVCKKIRTILLPY